MKGQYPPMKKLGERLEEWEAAGVKTVAEAEAWQKAHETRRASSDRGGSTPPANPALNYGQREYREEDFGDDFYFDVKKYREGGDPT